MTGEVLKDRHTQAHICDLLLTAPLHREGCEAMDRVAGTFVRGVLFGLAGDWPLGS